MLLEINLLQQVAMAGDTLIKTSSGSRKNVS